MQQEVIKIGKDDKLRKLKTIDNQKVKNKKNKDNIFKISAKKIVAGNRTLGAVNLFDGIKKKVASTVTRKAEEMMLKEWNKSKKAVEDNQLQVIQNFVQFNV